MGRSTPLVDESPDRLILPGTEIGIRAGNRLEQPGCRLSCIHHTILD